MIYHIIAGKELLSYRRSILKLTTQITHVQLTNKI